MESRIRKRALVYGVIAVLLVSSAAALSYRFGLYVGPEGRLPPIPAGPSALLATFTSYDVLKDFLQTNSQTQGPFPFYGPADISRLDAMVEGFDQSAKASSPGLTFDYSSTNIQVAGVDEVDIVKTDGSYIYTLSNNTLWIVKAYPPETAEVVTTIAFADVYPVGIFVSGDRLCVLGNRYFVPNVFYDTRYYAYHMVDIKTFAFIYDIQDRANPKPLSAPVGLTGSYFNSRMIGDYVYFVVSQPAYLIYDTVILPKIYYGDQLAKEISPSEIHYYNGSDTYYQYTTLVAVNLQNTTETPTFMTLMLGGTSSMYVSQENMYITFPDSGDGTTIYRVRIRASNLTAEAKGHVSGRELNQFSMDEFNGYFRIATASWVDGTPRSNLFVLDMNLTVVGKLLDIEVGETLDSARFMANRCYLSTSVVMRDPFFVIDVTDASEPEILGYLKIPGFTRYLHPYDEHHVIGVGRDENNRVRILLFNVTDVSAPASLSEYIFDGSWSDTEVLADHRAFLFAHSKNLLAIPATIYNYDHKTEQGLFLFNITLDDGIRLRGKITHQEAEVDYWNYTYYVRRALYIENVLYTLSDRKIQMNNLDTMDKIGEITLS